MAGKRMDFLSSGTRGLALSLIAALPAMAEMPPDRGRIDVSGEVHNSVCHLDMASVEQEINLGSITSAQLKKPGAGTVPVPLDIRLKDCVRQSGMMVDRHHGAMVWNDRGARVAVKFIGRQSEESPGLFAVSGAEGVGIRLSHQGKQVKPADHARPLEIAPADTTLRWYAALERTSRPLVVGPVRAVIDFQLYYY